MEQIMIIEHRLDLLLRLLDTVSGNSLVDTPLSFYINGVLFHPFAKGDGNYLFVDIGRENFLLNISAHGFLDKSITVQFENLEEAMPSIDSYLIPSPEYRARVPCHKISGQLPGLVAVDAIRLSDSICQIQGYDVRNHIVTIFNPHHVELTQVYYALLNPITEIYIPFEVKERVSNREFVIKGELGGEFASHDPISRIIFADVDLDGSYRFVAQNNGMDARYLFRFTSQEGVVFRTVDFNNL